MLPTRPSAPGRVFLAGFLALAALCIAWRRLLLQGLVPVDGSVIAITYPEWIVSRILWHLHRLPLWDPWRSLGSPYLADPASSALYPPMWIFSLAGDFPSFLSLWIVFHTLMSASTAGVLALRKGAGGPAAASVAALAAFNGFLLSRAVFPSQFAAACWLAPILLCVEKGLLWETGACFALQWLSGCPPVSALSLLAALCLGWTQDGAGVPRVLKSAAVGAGLCAVQWIPFLEYLSESSPGPALSPAGSPGLPLPPVALALGTWGALRGGRGGALLAAAAGACLLLGFYGPVSLGRAWLLPATAALCALAGLGVSLLGGGPRARWAAASLIAVELLVFAQRPTTAWALPETITDAPVLMERVAALPRLCRVHHDEALMLAWAAKGSRSQEGFASMRESLAPSYTLAFGLEDTGGFQALRPRRCEAFRSRVAASADRERLLDLAGVRLEIGLRPGESDLRRGSILSRARATSRPRVFLEGKGTVRIESYLPGAVRARVSAPAGGRLVFAETFFPGWTAEVDGSVSRDEPFEGAFQSVLLPPGEHVVKFVYRPVSFYLGMAVTILAAAAWAFAARRRQKEESS